MEIASKQDPWSGRVPFGVEFNPAQYSSGALSDHQKGFDKNTQWLKIARITDTDFFPKYMLKVGEQKVVAFLSDPQSTLVQFTANLVPTLNTLKEKDETQEYKGDELGEDILAIPLDDPVANKAKGFRLMTESSVRNSLYLR